MLVLVNLLLLLRLTGAYFRPIGLPCRRSNSASSVAWNGGDTQKIGRHSQHMRLSAQPRVEIEYCTGCRWLLRGAWLAQELLSTFEDDLGGVEL
jgi:hypothetical protein